MTRTFPIALVSTALAACASPQLQPPASFGTPNSAPRGVLPPGFDRAAVRADAIATARERYGSAAVERALASPAYLFAKRFVGMAPPPPAGAGPDWRVEPSSALLIQEGGQWLVATATGWRAASPEVSTDIDRKTAEPRLWSEPAYTLPCPDYGANLLVLKVSGQAETVRQSLCSGRAAGLAQAALNA